MTYINKQLERQWREATITNDVVFMNVMLLEDNLLRMIQNILPEEGITSIDDSEMQKNIKQNTTSKGVRLDVFAIGNNGQRIDIELQVENKASLGKRTRYYQSKLDQDALASGMDYKELPKSFVIFLCPTDPFNYGLKEYKFEYYNKETEYKLNTDSQIIMLNANGTTGFVSKGLQSFLDYMAGREYKSNSFIEQIVKSYHKVKRDKKSEEMFMNENLNVVDARHEGRAEGIAIGEAKGRSEGIAIGEKNGETNAIQRTIRMLRSMDMGNQSIIDKLFMSYGDKYSKAEIMKMVNETK